MYTDIGGLICGLVARGGFRVEMKRMMESDGMGWEGMR